MRRPSLSSVSSSLFAVATSLAFQVVLLVSGVGTAWLVGDVGRGVLAYGAVAATLSATLAAGGISSASAVVLRGLSVEDSRPLLAHIRAVAWRRGVLAVCGVSVGMTFVEGRIPTSVYPIALASGIAAVGLVQVQLFVGVSQGGGRTNLANAGRLVAPVVYAIGVASIAIMSSRRGEGLLVPVIAAWGLGWLVSIGFCSASTWSPSTGKRKAPPVHVSQAFRATDRRHFVASLATYEVLRVDQLVALLFLTTADLGVYSVSMSFTGLLKAMAATLGVASLGDTLDSGTRSSPVRLLFRRSVWIAVAAVVLLVSIPYAIDLLLPAEFEGAVVPSRLLVGAAAFAALRRSAVEIAKGLSLEYIGSATEILQVMLLFALAVPLASSPSGVAVAVLAALASSCLVTVLWLIYCDGRRLGAR